MPDLQLKRGTPAQVDAYQGPAGEIVVDSQNWNMRLQDGITAGGVLLGSNASLIARPEIVSPIVDAVVMDQSPIIASTAYSGEGIHSASQWQVSKQSDFGNLVHDSGRNTVSLTSYNLLAEDVVLDRGVAHYVRVRHESGTAGWSDWSEGIRFTVQAMEPGAVLEDGGIIFAQEGGDWLVVAPASQHVQRRWGLYGTDTTLPNWTSGSGTPTTPTDPNSSEYNTDVLTSPPYSTVNDGYVTGAAAAEYCRSIGYDLPNAKDLQLIYNNRTQINAADSTGNLPTTGVWSSTETNSYSAWALNFGGGNWGNGSKFNSNWVVPFRRIPV